MPALAQALRSSRRLTGAVRPGKQALEAADRARVTDGAVHVTESIALDSEFAADQPNASRWDYLVGVERKGAPRTGRVLAIEVHPATPREVKRVIAKMRWAEGLLDVELGSTLRPVSYWYWVASGRDGVSRSSAEFRLLQKNKIALVGQLRLDRR